MIASYPLGIPRPAAERGGDCRARDLDQERNVHGQHRFASSNFCQISNGMLRVTVASSGSAPSLSVECFTGYQSVGDVFWDVFNDIFPGAYSSPEWTAMGVVTIDSTLLTAVLTGVQITRLTPERVTIRLVSPVIADAYVTLRRGEPMIRIQHGEPRRGVVNTNRRVHWVAAGLTGSSGTGRVTETAPLTAGFTRFVGAVDSATSNAAAFSVTSAGVTSARFGAGVGTAEYGSTVADLHGQLADASLPRLVVT